ncbi:MAG TPA: undecaprenyldiphospho-muramoylpentapeptide beta-N-acetylglucosaminyltransferase [Nitrospirae bacterium]|nr:undecaprenyldiphospho-muramoylpentapeptide beta-N-acetylglucosaminyltransferase [Nitrospirota bacterium]
MRVIISGGGTGGHLYPAIALAEQLLQTVILKKIKKQDILFVGSEYGIEKKIVPQEGFQIELLNVTGFVGKSLFAKIKSIYKLLIAFQKTLKILNIFRPKIVIGSGGYVSIAMLLSAVMKGIPTIILEQNSIPGLANKILGKFVDIICITYEESSSFFPINKVYHTGNPIRSKILIAELESAYEIFQLDRQKKTILIFGGSKGAHSINTAVFEALPYLLDLKLYIQFIHQTGENDFEEAKEHYRKTGFHALVYKFIEKIPEAYKVSSLLICRAGATTLSEITAAGKASILIPYPYAASNHQEKNALRLEALGAAKVIKEKNLSGEVLAKEIRKLLNNEEELHAMELASSSIGKADAAEKIVSIALSLINKKDSKKH